VFIGVYAAATVTAIVFMFLMLWYVRHHPRYKDCERKDLLGRVVLTSYGTNSLLTLADRE